MPAGRRHGARPDRGQETIDLGGVARATSRSKVQLGPRDHPRRELRQGAQASGSRTFDPAARLQLAGRGETLDAIDLE